MPSLATSQNPRSRGHASRVLGQRYSLTKRIAVGGMGEVWSATDSVLGRQVAVKILRDDLVDSGVFLERFRAEARHTAALAHPGIASVFDYGEEGQGQQHIAYLVMELVPGEPLSRIIGAKGPLAVGTTVSLLAQTAEALHAAHRAGVVHRDVKPGNILVLEDGTIKVTDFGIARAVDSVALTEVGQVVGTARYISPEQAMGGEVTPASDIYSLGVIGYEMLAGRPPFTAGNVGALAMAHAHQPPPELPPSVPAGLRTAVGQALSKDPSDRPTNALEFAATLRRLQVDLPDATATVHDAALASSESDLQSPTRVMKVEDESRTAIMPPGMIMRSAPNLGVSDQAYAARRQRRRLGVAALAVIAFVVAFALLRDAAGPVPLDPTKITATTVSAAFVDVDPNKLIGHTLAEASRLLTEAGLVVDSRPVSALGVPAGVVGGVEPIGRVPKGATVTLDVSDGSTAITTVVATTEPDNGKGKGHGNGKGDD
jgi:eukaryotic-like serine/threonine-protein kinase